MKKILLSALVFLNSVIFAQSSIPRFSNETFDKIGVEHNKLLEEFFQKCIDNPNYVTDLNSMYSRIDEFKPDFLKSSLPNSESLIKQDIPQDSKALTYQSITKSALNQENYPQIKNSIEEIKVRVINDAELNNTDFNSIMAMLYVADYSSYFWVSKEKGGSGIGIQQLSEINKTYPANVFMKGESEEPESRVNWPSTRAEKDAMGGALGALQWCVTGSLITPGVGTAAGFVGGAIFGAFAASVSICNPEIVCQEYPSSYCCYLQSLFQFTPPLGYCNGLKFISK